MQPLAALAFATALLFATAPAGAQQIYKWKDAKGVTHYSEKPPAQGGYSTHDSVQDPAGAPAAPVAAGTPEAAASPAPAADDSRCDTARRNLAALQRPVELQFDSDGDGKPDRAMNQTERQQQEQLARSTLQAYNCSETASAG
jgi:hypothetical protein